VKYETHTGRVTMLPTLRAVLCRVVCNTNAALLCLLIHDKSSPLLLSHLLQTIQICLGFPLSLWEKAVGKA
jgi:hypothetical protein